MVDGRPSVLMVSGLDPTGGAGFIADVRLADRWGCRPVGVVTGLTVQDTHGLRAVELSSLDFVDEQLTALLADIEVDAVKVGMLGTLEMAQKVARALALTRAPVVWDPVAAPSHGQAKLLEGALMDVANVLSDHVVLMTPNVDEAELLSGLKIVDAQTSGHAAQAISTRWNTAVLVSGGHLAGPPVDVLAHRGDVTEVVGQRVEGANDVHGTGCALATAIACALARGFTVSEAVIDGCRRVRELLPAAPLPGRGHRAVV
jgi:hydroxymethylpyrimidine kinase/phosphomethylpyrimidine kinase